MKSGGELVSVVRAVASATRAVVPRRATPQQLKKLVTAFEAAVKTLKTRKLKRQTRIIKRIRVTVTLVGGRKRRFIVKKYRVFVGQKAGDYKRKGFEVKGKYIYYYRIGRGRIALTKDQAVGDAAARLGIIMLGAAGGKYHSPSVRARSKMNRANIRAMDKVLGTGRWCTHQALLKAAGGSVANLAFAGSWLKREGYKLLKVTKSFMQAVKASAWYKGLYDVEKARVLNVLKLGVSIWIIPRRTF